MFSFQVLSVLTALLSTLSYTIHSLPWKHTRTHMHTCTHTHTHTHTYTHTHTRTHTHTHTHMHMLSTLHNHALTALLSTLSYTIIYTPLHGNTRTCTYTGRVFRTSGGASPESVWVGYAIPPHIRTVLRP